MTSCWQLRKQRQRQMRLGCFHDAVHSMSSLLNRSQLSAVLSCGVLCGLGSLSTVDRCSVSEATKLDEAAHRSVNIDRMSCNCQLPCLLGCLSIASQHYRAASATPFHRRHCTPHIIFMPRHRRRPRQD